ncbi:heparan-alpha-glucosaminide N-acetyltransferase domain-containing protein [Schumannella sp. 10F1B-5-1]|uniref:heparan-alpha-glucosaminide N-acetyltransferase domain-containing protein n=1 Tax=Schumannella sp. 10F1B-5-1 TaxID=2590780 RepID=UPI001131770A|nr:heparan-alpha-glucosaminide N-acetyltransferase domain-containing protein [Schumannella sp. 10F1B-5-1]TPW73103.1 DUF1624 domain-containing protein [Schumannella sp. 10F1B-5-1]
MSDGAQTGTAIGDEARTATERQSESVAGGHGDAAVPPRSTSRASTGRLVAIDVARFIAIVGMMGNHLALGYVGALSVAVSGFPSTLFAVLGGVSAVLSTRGYVERGQRLAASLSLAARGVVVALIGVALGLTPTFVAVVLVYYGVGMIVTALLLHLPGPALVAIAAALVIGGPHLNVFVHDTANLDTLGELSFADPLQFLRSVAFTGMYPVVTWLVYMLIGVLAARALLSPDRLRAAIRVAIVGAGMLALAVTVDLVSRPAVIAALMARGAGRDEADYLVSEDGFGVPIDSGWIAVVNAAPHTGSTGDIVRTAGAALLLIGLLVVIGELWRRRVAARSLNAVDERARRIPLLLRPIAAAGSAPLTLYTLHVLATAVIAMIITGAIGLPGDGGFGMGSTPWWLMGASAWAVHIVAALLLGVVLAALKRRGPLEAFASLVARAAARLG